MEISKPQQERLQQLQSLERTYWDDEIYSDAALTDTDYRQALADGYLARYGVNPYDAKP